MTTRSGHPYAVEQEETSNPNVMDMLNNIMERMEQMDRKHEAQNGELKDQMIQQFAELNRRVADIEHPQQNPRPVPEHRPERRRFRHETSEEEYDGEDMPRRGRQGRRNHHPEDEIVRQVRVESPIFDGSLNPQVCKDWIQDMDQYFLWYDFPEARKVMFAKMKLVGNAKQFWLAEEIRQEQSGRPPVDQWETMKRIFVCKYVPDSFNDQLKAQFVALKQGSMSVHEYTTKFDEFVVKCAVVEDDQLTIARYRNGLRHDIQHEMELVPFSTLHHSYQKATQYEHYLKSVQKHNNSVYKSCFPITFRQPARADVD